jgi:hypothetical protein
MAGQRIELPPYSMMAKTPVYDVGGTIVFGLMADVIVPDLTDNLFIIPLEGVNRLDLISDEFYGTPELWWVLARVNNIQDALVGVPVGTTIRIPTKDRLASAGVLNV